MLLLIGLLLISANAKIVPLEKLKVGDIVDIENLSYESTKILDDIFNGFDATRFIETENHEDVFSLRRQKDVCVNSESFTNYDYSPRLYVDDKKLILPPKMKNVTTIKYNNININPSHINDNYLFSIVKVCLLDSEKYLNVELFSEFDYSMVFWHTKEMCRDYLQNSSLSAVNNSFFDSYVYKSQIFTGSGNISLENQINNRVQQISLTEHLVSFFEGRKNLFDKIDKKTVVRIEFRSLPNPPKRTNGGMVPGNMSLKLLEPGDVINIDAENTQYYFNAAGITYKYEKPPSMVQEYTHCYENEKETLTPKTSYSTDSDHPDHYHKFSVFHQTIQSYNYGVDKEYLNNNYKCLKFTICSGLRGQKSSSPNFKIVDLENFSGSNKYNFFENENIALIYGRNYSTSYHVNGVESGDCLFQALMYNASTSKYNAENFRAFPVQRGRIMSASGDHYIENRIKIFLASNPWNIFESLFTAKFDVLDVSLPVFNMLSNSVTVNLYLKKID
ncbi:hypothetical protein KQX54_018181 [Cotesia glomerata]|uniref:Uncharacterized protein n=1 Tax=Cotesia glomerata TaxID=32391 RepID=A0AAV7HWE5_COTGL|nr:hypothetical protein KQX54_018181 [Cotesia glomerata]